MKREEYLAELKLKLEEHDFGPVEEAITYFNDLLEDRMADEGMDEEAAVASLEAPDKVAAQLQEGQPGQKAQETGEAESFMPGVRTITARADQVRHIRVRDRNMRLTLIGENREDIQIRHPETEKVRYNFSLEDGTLSLIREEIRLSFQLFVFDIEMLPREMREVEIRLPRELAAEMDLRTSNARLTLEHIACWGKVEAATSNARLEAKDLSAKSLRLKASNGALKLERASAQQMIHAATSNARLNAEGVSAPSLLLKTSNGALEVDGVTSDDITLSTSNGAIKGELPGNMSDYAISSGTSNGKNALPPQTTGGSKRLSAHTSNASIRIGFSGEDQQV